MPSPPGVPVLGNLLQLDTSAPRLWLTKWADEYGGVYNIQLMFDNMVIVSSYEGIREVMLTRGEYFTNRPSGSYRINCAVNFESDLSMTNPDVPFWVPLRKALQRSLHQYGGGMEQIEMLITTETQRWMTRLRDYGTEQRDVHGELYDFTTKITYFFLTGLMLDDDDPMLVMFKEIEQSFVKYLSMTGPGAELDAMPWLRFIGNPAFKSIRHGQQQMQILWNRLKQQVGEPLYDTDDGKYRQPVMQAIRHIQQTLKDEKGRPVMTDGNSMAVMTDMILGGITTTTHTMYALINLLLHHPEIAVRLQQEVDHVVGQGRLPCLKDREAMPYTQACLLETLRYTSVISLGVPHSTNANTQLCGFTVPKDTVIITNLWALHHDKEFWGDPWKFRPERWLDMEGRIVAADHPLRKHLLAFGSGPRVCLGEVFANTRLFLSLTTLVQNFSLLPPSVDQLVSSDCRTYTEGIILQQPKYTVGFLPRAHQAEDCN